MNICYQNVRGLNSKLSRLFVDSYDFDFDVIVFSETWLKDNVLNSEIFCNKYIIYRKDRPNKIGGGVLIAVNSSFSSESVIIEGVDDLELIAISINLGAFSLYITCSYIPPSSEFEIYMGHLNAFTYINSRITGNDVFLILGDFNLPHVCWLSLPDTKSLTPLTPCDWSSDFVRLLTDIELVQLNDIVNSMNRILDLVLVNDPNRFDLHRTDPLSFPEDRYHPTIGIDFSYPVNAMRAESSAQRVFCFSRANFTLLNDLIHTVDWIGICQCNNAYDFDIVLQRFYNIIFGFMSRSIPKKSVQIVRSPPWISRELSSMKNAKSRLFKRYKKSGLAIDYGKYSVARYRYSVKSRECYRKYINNMRNNFKSDPKSFYNFVNSKRKSSLCPSKIRLNGVEHTDGKDMADCFADFFASVYSTATFQNDFQYPYCIKPLDPVGFQLFDSSTILSNLNTIKPCNKPGPDGIPNSVLRYCSESLSIPLTILFNTSLKLGYFPTIWKKSYLIPLHKSGSLIDASNYRGIAKLNAIPKLFEKLVTNSISHFVSPIIHPCQHGFRKGHSTVSNLIQFSSSIIGGFVSGKQTDVIYTDFSKAFDKVNHRLLMSKLDAIGLNGNVLEWISSYLQNREQIVYFGNAFSKSISVTSGVPQGSHLGPVLFLLFINDLPGSVVHSDLLMFADDVKIFLSYNDSYSHLLLQEDLDKFYTWCDTNLMQLNLKKCKHMVFSRSTFFSAEYFLGGCSLDCVNSILDLGILLDRKLDFNSHIITTVNKAYGVLAFIKRWSKEFSDPYITKGLFTSLVRPILEYGSVIWDPQYYIYINMIESVQKQFLLFCLRNLRWNPEMILPSYESRLALIRLPTLKSRRTMLNTLTMLRIVNGDLRSEYLLSKVLINVPFRPTRYYNPLHICFQRSNYAEADPLRRMCSQFNALYQFIDFSKSLDSIKSELIEHLNRLH